MWNSTLGMVDLNAYLSSRRCDLNGMTLFTAAGVSANGTAMAGSGSHASGQNIGWYASNLPEPCIGMARITDPQDTCRRNPAAFEAPAVGLGPFQYTWLFADNPAGPWSPMAEGANLGPGGTVGFQAVGTDARHVQLVPSTSFVAEWPEATVFVRCEASNACDTAVTLPIRWRVCAADRNCDGEVDLVDFFAFFNCWDVQDDCGDVDGVPGIDLGDFFRFLNAFDRGC